MEKTQTALAGLEDRFEPVIKEFAGRGKAIGSLGELFDEKRDHLEDRIFVACCRALKVSSMDPYLICDSGFFSDGLSLGRALSGQVLNYACGKITKEETLDGIMDIIVETHNNEFDTETPEGSEGDKMSR